MTFTLNASEALIVTGAPTLTFSNGAAASYASGSGTSALAFTYTVGANDTNVADLTVTGLNTPTGTAIRDAAGNAVTFNAASVGNAPGTLRIDTAAPNAPGSLALASDTGASATDGITSDATVKGTAEAGSTVTLRVGSTTVGTGTADGSGNFFIAPASGLSQGPNTISATATDAAGNASGATSITFTLDTGAPAVAPSPPPAPGSPTAPAR